LTLSTQVPLAKQALMLTLLGPGANEAALAGELQTFLSALDGKSNWLSDEERSEKLGRLVGTIVGVVIGLGIVLWWRRRRRAQS